MNDSPKPPTVNWPSILVTLLLVILGGGSIVVAVAIDDGKDTTHTTTVKLQAPRPVLEAEDHGAGQGERNVPALPAQKRLPRLDGLAPATARKTVVRTGWIPGAVEVLGRSAGSYVDSGWRITLHTTEGSSAAGAIGAYRATGSWPQLTVTYETGSCKVYQHMSLFLAGRALEHPFGVETNRAHNVQIEMVGFARDTPSWSAGHYACIRSVLNDIAHIVPVKLQVGVKFVPVFHENRLSQSAWLSYKGILGHQHVPMNHHTDPGQLRVGELVAAQPISRRQVKRCITLNKLRRRSAVYRRRHRLPPAKHPLTAKDKALAKRIIKGQRRFHLHCYGPKHPKPRLVRL